MKRTYLVLKNAFLMMLTFLIVACNGDQGGFLIDDKGGNNQPYAGEVISVELLIQGNNTSVTLLEGEQVPASVKLNLKTGGAVYALWEDLDYHYQDQAFTILDGMLIANKGRGTSAPVEVIADYHGIKSQPVAVTVNPRDIRTIQLAPPSTQLAVGFSRMMDLTATYSDGVRVELDPSVARWEVVDEVELASGTATSGGMRVVEGRVYADHEGRTAKIVASYNGKDAESQIETTDAVLQSVAMMSPEGDMQPRTLVLNLGMSQAVTTQGVFSDGTTVPLEREHIDYEVSSPVATSAIAVQSHTYDNNDDIVAMNRGSSSDIFARYNNGHVSLDSPVMQVLVPPSQLESLVISTPEAQRNLAKGLGQQLEVEAHMDDGSVYNVTSAATWQLVSESPNLVVSVTPQGYVSSLNVGRATVSASFGGMNAEADVVVSPSTLAYLTVDPLWKTVSLDQTLQFTAIAHFVDGSRSEVDHKDISWSVTTVNGSYPATISNTGLLETNAAGVVNVHGVLIKDTRQSASSVVMIEEKVVDSVSASINNQRIAAGQSANVKASVTYTDGSVEDITARALWRSADTDIAMVTSGEVRGLSKGDVQIWADFRGVSSNHLNVSVTDAIVESLQITPEKIENLPLGYEEQLTLTARFSDNTVKQIDPKSAYWSSSDRAIARVNSTGGVTAYKANSDAVITATYSAASDTTPVTTSEAVVNGVIMTKEGTATPVTNANLAIDQRLNLDGYAHYSNGDTRMLDSDMMKFFSENSSVASVSPKGEVTALTSGSTEIHFEYQGFTSQKMALDVTGSDFTNLEITLQGAAADDLHIDTDYTLIAEAELDGGKVDVTKLAQWSIDDTSVGVMSEFSPGVLQTKHAGPAIITADFKGMTSTLGVTVSNKDLTGISIDPPSATLKEGEVQVYSATASFSSGADMDVTNQLHWSIDDPSIAKVEPDTSKFTAVKAGSTKVIASNGEDHWEADLTVDAKDTGPEVTSILIVLSGNVVNVGETLPFTAQLYMEDSAYNNYAAQDVVTWVSSKPDIAYVDEKGVAHGLKAGRTQIKATYGGKESASQELNVH